jgi:hypothetical protein
MSLLHWARLQVDVKDCLRRGAWYRVKRLLPRDVVLEVNGMLVTVPRTHLQLTTTPPTRWTVVSQPAHTPGRRAWWAADYAVCPGCRARAPFDGHPPSMRCPRCNGLFEVAWGERSPVLA